MTINRPRCSRPRHKYIRRYFTRAYSRRPGKGAGPTNTIENPSPLVNADTALHPTTQQAVSPDPPKTFCPISVNPHTSIKPHSPTQTPSAILANPRPSAANKFRLTFSHPALLKLTPSSRSPPRPAQQPTPITPLPTAFIRGPSHPRPIFDFRAIPVKVEGVGRLAQLARAYGSHP